MLITSRHRHALVLIALFSLLAGASVLLQDVFGEVVTTLAAYEESRPIAGRALFVLLAAASVMLGPFTSAPLMPFAVGVWGTWQTLALLMLGWAFGNAAAYGIGSHVANPILGRVVPTARLEKWMRFLGEEVDAFVLFLIRLAAPSEIGYAFGMLKYHFRTYMVIVLLAEIPFAVTLTFGGEAFINGRWHALIGFAVAAFALMGLAWVAYRAVTSRRARSTKK